MRSRTLFQFLTLGYLTSNQTPTRTFYTLSSPPTTKATMPKGAVLALSHGGGPLPVLGDPAHESLVASMRNRAPKILGLDSDTPPRAIVLVTAHWQTAQPIISSGATHSLIYDYGGFPPESYTLKYPAPGHPEIAGDVKAALEAEGIDAKLDDKRGWDHGVFIPMLLIRPQADIPVVQVSILESQDPAAHLRLGRALARLRDSNVAILGSGFASFHNLRNIFALMRPTPLGLSADQKQSIAKLASWNEGLIEALKTENRTTRDQRIEAWREIEGSYEAHPEGGADHLMPLIVCAGASEEGEPIRMYKDDFFGVGIWSFYWGAEEVE